MRFNIKLCFVFIKQAKFVATKGIKVFHKTKNKLKFELGLIATNSIGINT